MDLTIFATTERALNLRTCEEGILLRETDVAILPIALLAYSPSYPAAGLLHKVPYTPSHHRIQIRIPKQGIHLIICKIKVYTSP